MMDPAITEIVILLKMQVVPTEISKGVQLIQIELAGLDPPN